MRMIDADNLAPDICDAKIEYGTKPVHFSANAIDFAPTIDAVPVVRCKDCKHRFNDSWCEYVDDDNFYCARGERKGGAD